MQAKEVIEGAHQIDWAAANARYAVRRGRESDGPLAELNAEQCRAAVAADERNIIIAGAGTGKTRTLVALVADHVGRGEAKPHQIAFVTFTIKAAAEIRERIRDALGRTRCASDDHRNAASPGPTSPCAQHGSASQPRSAMRERPRDAKVGGDKRSPSV